MRRISPCPFCGKKAMLDTNKETFEELLAKNGRSGLNIICEDYIGCGARIFAYSGDAKDDSYETVVDVVTDRWNRRTFNA